MQNFDAIIVGAGMAGISLAYELAASMRVLVLEMEEMPAYHSTGRSSALFDESYGKEAVRRMTLASRSFLENPPEGFCEHPLLSPRGLMVIGSDDQKDSLDQYYRDNQPLLGNLQYLDRKQLESRVSILGEHVKAAVLSPGCRDIDVAAQFQGYHKLFLARGGKLHVSEPVLEIVHKGGHWQLKTAKEEYGAPIMVNAAGAWADSVAHKAGITPKGLQALRRTVALIELPVEVDYRNWPLVMDADEAFYFKPESGLILLTPADEEPVEACDIQPDDLDIAIAVDRFEKVTGLEINKVGRRWAGLRTFAPDRVPVIGEDPAHKGFFWLAGQGGYGIMTAPANAMFCSAMIQGNALPANLLDAGVKQEQLSPGRFQ